jgi:Tol biopolymer transport system component
MLVGCGAVILCTSLTRRASTQSTGLRRITITSEEGLNLNPSISGDGQVIAFESTEDLAGAGGANCFRAFRANVAPDSAALVQMVVSRAVAPAISQDGSHIAFASTDDPLSTNRDGNSEIFLFDGSKLVQITNTSPGSLADRIRNGSFQPSISNDGRFIAFSSNRDLTNQNPDGNLEIFVHDVAANSFAQLTDSSGIVGCGEAKISGDGSSVAYIRDTGTTPGALRDLIRQTRSGGSPIVVAANIESLAMTYGRAISDDGSRIVYSAQTAPNTTQVFMYDGRGSNSSRQTTSLAARVTEVPLDPTISGDGSRIAFATRRSVAGAGNNSDGSVELYLYDLPTATFSKITNAPSSATAEVVSALNDDGSILAFNFPRVLSGPVANSGTENNSEIYAMTLPARPANGILTAILNHASLGHEPSAAKAVAPDSIAIAQGTNLANTTIQSQPLANGTFPTGVAGTRVTVNGRPAQIFSVSPTQVNFLVPAPTEIGTAEVIVLNAEDFPSVGTVTILPAAPGIFTRTGDGIGEGLILNAFTLQEGPFDPTSDNLRLTIFATGARNAAVTAVSIGGRALAAEAVLPSAGLPGLDEVHLRIPPDLRGAGNVKLSLICDGRESNPVTVSFLGDPSRAIVINEVLADPPDGIAGDANHDGIRDGTQDEFVEIVNASASEAIGLSGWTIRTRATGSTNETTRLTFPPATNIGPGEAALVFGGGNFTPNDPIFGCAQVFKANSPSSGLSLSNSGLTILVRDAAGNLITQFSYGGATGLEGNSSQSLTRSPDITGRFALHSTTNSPRRFSPGVRIDGTPFGDCPGHLTRTTISPESTTIVAGQTTQFTARALDEYGRAIAGVTFNFISDNAPVAAVESSVTEPSTGVWIANVMARQQGRAHIQATANSGNATLQVAATLQVIPKLTRIELTPSDMAINRGNTQPLIATAFDQNNQPLTGLTFNWNSSNLSIATVDANGLARAVGFGAATITASAADGLGATVSASTTLVVQVPLVINEINADVQPDNPATAVIEGDANRDGVRNSDDDEFLELLNNSKNTLDLSGIIVADATSSRFTFPAHTTLAAGRAVVVFGGANPPADDPAFGGAMIFTASSLSLNDAGDTINLKLPISGTDVLIASQTYGASSGVPPPVDQSLTRSPDAEVGGSGGPFGAHLTAANAGGRAYSPGTRSDGTPFGSPPLTRIEVSPTTTRADVGATVPLVAHAFSNSAGAEAEIQNVSFIWDSTDASRATLAPATGQAVVVMAQASGNTTIRARAGSQQGATVLSVNPTLSIDDISRNEGDTSPTRLVFTVTLSTPAPAGGVIFDVATQDGTATVANNDYIPRNLTAQTIPAGAQVYSFAVTVNGDMTIEPDETFFVNVTNVSGATITRGRGQGTIINDDDPVLSIADVSQNEGDAGSATLSFAVVSSLPAPTGGISFDIATQDNTAVAPVDYDAKSLTNQIIPEGQRSYVFDVTVNGDTLVEPNESFFVKVTRANGNPKATGTIVNDDEPNLVISQVYGGGNNAGAPFRNDFVEIFNRGDTSVDFGVMPYSIQYASTGSNFGSNKTNLTAGTMPPHHYFLVQEAGGTTNGGTLPLPDATGTIALASTSGKVALVAGTNLLPASTCPGDEGVPPFNISSSSVVDLVGYGDTSTTVGHCYQGSAPAAALSNSTAGFRKAGSCVATNNNSNDFFVAQPSPRNSASPTGSCQPEIIISDVTVTEANTVSVTATFTVGLTSSTTEPVAVDFATSDGTATAASDYQSNTGTLTFEPGETTKTIRVLVNGDTRDEPVETFFVNLSGAVNAVIVDGRGQATINDNDPPPAISINDVTIFEGNSGATAATFAVTLSGATDQTVAVNYATADQTATSPVDYQATNGTLTFNPGETTKNITVAVNGDTEFEPDESFLVNLSAAVNATLARGQSIGTIANDDAAPLLPTFSINDVSVKEGDNGQTTATFAVTLTLATDHRLMVEFATANGTAVAGVDYESSSETLVFNAGETTREVTVTIDGDEFVEPDETFFAILRNATTNTVIGKSQGIATIENDDFADLVISQVYPGGALSNATYANDFVELFNRGTTTVDFSVVPYSVQFLSTSGSSWAKTDLTTGTVLPGHYFLIKEAGGATGAALPVADAIGSINLTSTTNGKVALVAGRSLLVGNCPGDDGIQPFNPAGAGDFAGYGGAASTANHCYEGTAPSSFSLGNNTIADYRRSGGCADTNNNAADFFTAAPWPRNSHSTNNCAGVQLPNLTINDTTVTEGNSGTTTAAFTVSLSTPPQGSDVSFDIATEDAGATTADSDYVARSLKNQIIPAGQTSYAFNVIVNGDTDVEPDEQFLVNVTNVVGAAATSARATGTIHNDDLPAISISDAAVSEGNNGTATLDFTVSLSAPAPAPVAFDIGTKDGTATAIDRDYIPKSLGAQTIPAAQQTYHFSVTINGDTNVEPNETLMVTLTNVTNAIVADDYGEGTILNDDSPVLSITPAVALPEGNGGASDAVFTVTLSPAAAQTVTVQYATADGTASSDVDYQSRSGMLTFDPGETAKTIKVPVNGDLLFEPDETFILSLANASANTLISATAGTSTVTILNDDTPLIVISQVYGGGGNTSAPAAVYKNDFIEIFNRGTTTVDLAGWSVQYDSAGGTGNWSVTKLCGTGSCLLPPGRYFLVQETSGSGGTQNLPPPDATGATSMATTSGKLALVTNTLPLSGACPSGTSILDQVGYGGSTATTDFCYEGNGPTAAPGNLNAVSRKSNGCLDTNDNANDFSVAAASPRNSSATINDCNAPPLLSIDHATQTEGNISTGTFAFTVSLSKPALAGGVMFDIATSDGTAGAGTDYVAKSLTSQVIPAGEQTYTFDVTINGDTMVESDETFFVDIRNVVGATILDGHGVGTIENDDTPALTINNVTANEGNSEPTAFDFTVTLSPASNQTVSVNYATEDGTAMAGTDYVAILPTQISFAPGETQKTITVTVNGDTSVEPDETFVVNLSDATNADIGTLQGTATIVNDDGAAVVISQIYAGGGNSGAPFTNDFVEIFNRTTTAIDLSSWSIQTATATGTSWTVIRLCPVGRTCLMGASKYYLVQLGSGGTAGLVLPAPDALGSTNFATTGGKVALVAGTAAIGGNAAGTAPLGGATCPNANTINVIDFVGYGSASCFEGTAAGPGQTNTTAAFRASTGCLDADRNSSDFSTGTPNPRNSGTAVHACP